MCGLSAIFAPETHVRPTDLVRMTRAVTHRGPDDGGFVFIDGSENRLPLFVRDIDGNRPEAEILGDLAGGIRIEVGMGHRRLSIVDLSSAGTQPMASPDGRYWVTYNGEIYNHVELREELARLGHAFRSTSDTEVLLAAYAHWGQQCLERFNGMFAFVLYDRRERTVFVARDRFGVKPLYYWRAPNGALHFASEVKQFAELPGWRPRLNGARAYDFLAWGLSDHTRETSFRDVFQLLPGHCATFHLLATDDYPEAGRPWPAERVWYRLRPAPVPQSLEEAAEGLRQRLLTSVSLRLRSDVPVGANLSGGMDSSTIVCLLDQLHQARGSTAPFYCLSAGSDYPQFDERRYVDHVVRQVRAAPLFVDTRFEELEQNIRRLVWHQDEPFASTSIYAEWCIYRQAAASGIKVMLGGQGADEQLAGYPEHIGHFYRGWLRKGALTSLVGDVLAAHRQRGTPWPAIMTRLADALMPQLLRQPLRNYRGASSRQPSWLDPVRLGVEPHDPFDTFGYRNASVRDASRIQLESTNLPMQLRWEDRDSMAHSVESRAPYLDVDLVEYLYGLPDHFRYSHGESKRVLRRAMRGIVPAPIIDRRDKMGFVTPEEIWVRHQGRHFFQSAVDSAIDSAGGIIRPDAARHFAEMIEGKRRFSHSLWRVAAFGMWLRRFDVVV